MTPPTDVIIPVHNALPQLRECLEYLEKNTKDYRLILVNDWSGPDTVNFMNEYTATHSDVRMVSTDKQKWFSRASNIGLKLTTSDWFVLLNSDTIPRPGWLEELYAVRDEVMATVSPQVAVVAGHVARDPSYPRWQNVKHPAYATGHCFLINRLAYNAMCERNHGVFFNERDVNQIHINSDRIVCWEFMEMGWLIIRACNCEIDHVGGSSWRRTDTGEHDLQTVGKLTLRDVD
jgi:glycosyltransferase involved in cell wall biosynthesis